MRHQPRRFRATVWHLSSVAACVDGDAALSRMIIEEDATDARMFEAQIRDRWIHDVDADVSFGPISAVSPSRLSEAPQQLEGDPTLEIRSIAERLETYYAFTCEGGPLKNCVEWQRLRQLAEKAFLAGCVVDADDAIDALIAEAQSGATSRLSEAVTQIEALRKTPHDAPISGVLYNEAIEDVLKLLHRPHPSEEK